MRRSRRRRRGIFIGTVGVMAAGVVVGYWVLRPDVSQPLETVLAATGETARPRQDDSRESGRSTAPRVGRREADAGRDDGEARLAEHAGSKSAPAADARPSARMVEIDALWKRYQSGDVVAARHEMNAMLANGGPPEEQSRLRQYLTDIARETIFSARRLPDDPLVDVYKVESGDVLIKIGQRFDVPAGVLMRINGIRDARGLRAGQNIKVVNGPFHAKIITSEFRLDLYLRDLYVGSYPVALGAEGRTPLGVWRVKERLENPTYYPPAGAKDRRIIAGDDPTNPLAEHWIGLEGIEGDAVGQVGYGIHGTIEPESIGKPVSLGCVRLLNDDVAFVYSALQPGKSTVASLP